MTIYKNERFKQQIFNNLKCENISYESVKKLKYNTLYLEKVFLKYNKCHGNIVVTQNETKDKLKVNFTVKAGVNSSSMDASNAKSNVYSFDFPSKTALKFGGEFEFIMPFNKNKWALIVEPTLQTYKSETTIIMPSYYMGNRFSKIDYKSVELPMGVRHYFFLTDKSKVFVNAAIVLDFSFDSTLPIDLEDGSNYKTLDISSLHNYCVGVGYKYNDKYSLELRYYTPREVLSDYMYWKSNYNSLSITLGYTLF